MSAGARLLRLHDPAAQRVELGELGVHAGERRVQQPGDEVIWSTTNAVAGVERAAAEVMLDELYALSDRAATECG